jgi:hypothetical protein
MPEEEYRVLLTQADSAMGAKQSHLARTFRLGQYPRFDYDEAQDVLVFSETGIARVVAAVEFVGEVSRRDSVWTWAWDMPVLQHAAGRARKVRWYGWRHGLPWLRQARWSGDDVDGWEMTSLTAWLTDAEGAYRAPSSDSLRYTFMLLTDVQWAPPGRSVDSYITSPRQVP